jgi:hypothetical protein
METRALRKGLETRICNPAENPGRKISPPGGNPAGKERRDRAGKNPGHRGSTSPLGGRISPQKGERRE